MPSRRRGPRASGGRSHPCGGRLDAAGGVCDHYGGGAARRINRSVGSAGVRVDCHYTVYEYRRSSHILILRSLRFDFLKDLGDWKLLSCALLLAVRHCVKCITTKCISHSGWPLALPRPNQELQSTSDSVGLFLMRVMVRGPNAQVPVQDPKRKGQPTASSRII